MIGEQIKMKAKELAASCEITEKWQRQWANTVSGMTEREAILLQDLFELFWDYLRMDPAEKKIKQSLIKMMCDGYIAGYSEDMKKEETA